MKVIMVRILRNDTRKLPQFFLVYLMELNGGFSKAKDERSVAYQNTEPAYTGF